MMGYRSDCVGKLLSCDYFLKEFAGHTRMLVLEEFSEEHMMWWLVVGVALLHDPVRVFGAFRSSWDPRELPFLIPYVPKCIEYARCLPLEYRGAAYKQNNELSSLLQSLGIVKLGSSVDLQGILQGVAKKVFPSLLGKLSQPPR